MRNLTCTRVMLASVFGLMASGCWAAADSPISIDERAACQSTIEDLRWAQREWPKGNPGTKPARSTAVSDERIREAVLEHLQQEALLASRYGVRLDRHALQTELNRIAHETRAPADLQRIFAALGNDPALIAECLVRPHLAQMRLREAYARDEQIHAETRNAALRAMAATELEPAALASGARTSQVVYLRAKTALDAIDSPGTTGKEWHREQTATQHLPAEEFEQLRTTLLAMDAEPQLARRPDERSATALRHALSENRHGFELVRLLRIEADTFTVQSIFWPKRAFEDWLQEQLGVQPQILSVNAPGKLQLPEILPSHRNSAKFAADTWRIESFPEPRRNATAVWTGSEMIIWGGNTTGLDVATGSRYDPVTDSWKPTSMIGAPNPSSYHRAVWTGSEMLVWGLGPQGAGRTAGRYHPASDTWSPISNVGEPTLRDGHSADWTGTEMLVWGGDTPSSPPFNSGGRYNPATDSWQPTSFANAPSPRDRHSTVWTGSELIVWGGCGQAICPLNDGARYDPASDSWITLPSLDSPSARFSHPAVWSGSEMIIWGGCCSPLEGGRFNLASNTWSGMATVGEPSPRYLHTAVWSGEAMLVWGGIGYLTTNPNGVGLYDPVTDTWAEVSGNGAPPGRALHVAIWTGSEMIVWGGGTDVGRTDMPGGRFSPATSQWMPVAHSQAPQARYSHSAVWSGNELLIWGGMNQTGATFERGARYEPATDFWDEITASGAPVPRYENRAVWTGSEMIVWGGVNTDFYTTLATGGRYNPALDSWSATSDTDVPEGRYRHSMEWTGSEMLVWGGWRNGSYEPINTGARYDPASDSWVAINLVGAPSPRGWHASTWSGSELLVWGGAGPDLSPLGDGGRYNPAGNSWQALSDSNAPTARYATSAVWSGSEMLVLAGYGADGIFTSDGARYRPASDTWAPMSAPPSGLASMRETPMLWTGSEMIAWGGNDPNWFLIGGREGGRYDPAGNAWLSTSLDFAPEGRFNHTINWTGSSMLVWGGCCTLASLGVYYPYPSGEPSTTDLMQLSPSLLRLGEMAAAQAIVSGSTIAPIDGRLRTAADSGESCSAYSADSVDGLIATYTCSLGFTSLGTRSVLAAFSHSSSHLDSASSPHLVSVMRFADLSVAVLGPTDPVSAGEVVAFSIQLSNQGPDQAPGTRLEGAADPALVDAAWSCTASGGADCPAASGSGQIDLVMDVPSGGELQFQLTGHVPDPLAGPLSFSVTASPAAVAPHYVHDPDAGNNAVVLDVPGQLIFRDGFE